MGIDSQLLAAIDFFRVKSPLCQALALLLQNPTVLTLFDADYVGHSLPLQPTFLLSPPAPAFTLASQEQATTFSCDHFKLFAALPPAPP